MRGRPVGSVIRQKILEILCHVNSMHGYEVYKHYQEIFGRVAMKSIYYNLNKGVDLGEIEIESSREEVGQYSWGDKAMKTYFKLGPKANPKYLKYVRKKLHK
jgi:DNA-binding PadR family transcriptional regulator